MIPRCMQGGHQRIHQNRVASKRFLQHALAEAQCYNPRSSFILGSLARREAHQLFCQTLYRPVEVQSIFAKTVIIMIKI